MSRLSRKSKSERAPLLENKQPNNSVYLSYHDYRSETDIDDQQDENRSVYSTSVIEAADLAVKQGKKSLFRCAATRDFLLMVSGCVFSIICGSTIPMLSIAFGNVIDAMADELAGKGGVDFLAPSIEYLVLGLIIFSTGYIQVVCWRSSAERQALAWRCQYFDAILCQDISWFDDKREGALNNQLNEDVEMIRVGIGENLPQILMGLTSFFTAISISTYSNWQVFVTAILIAPFYTLLLRYMKNSVERLTVIEQEQQALASSIAEETISNVRTVRTFNAETQQTEKYNFALGIARSNGVKRIDQLAVTVFSASVLTYLLLAVILGVGTLQTNSKTFSAGSVFTCLIALLVGIQALLSALQRMGTLVTAINASQSMADVITKSSTLDSQRGGGLVHEAKGDIQFKNVCFSYPSRPEITILQYFNLNIPSGSSVALVGATGSGKTTLSNLLLRFYDVQYGQVLLDKHPVKTIDLRHLRSLIGYVPQQPMLFDMSIKENLLLAKAGATKTEMIDALQTANVWHDIAAMPEGINTRVGDLGSQLSGGQKQRIAIARALIRNPTILIFDEATSALDSTTEREVQMAIKQASSGRTSITIAHRLSTVRDVDQVVVLANGVVIEQGSYNDLLSLDRGIFRRMHELQSQENVNKLPAQDVATEKAKSIFSSRHSTISIRRKLKGSSRHGTVDMAHDAQRSMKEILRYNRQSNMPYVLSILCYSLSASTMVVFMVVMSQMLETYAEPSATDNALLTALLWALLIVFIGAVNGLARATAVGLFFCLGPSTMVALCGRCSEALALKTRTEMFSNILRQPVSYFDDIDNSIGSIASRLSCGAADLGKAVQNLAEVIAQSWSILIGLIIGLVMAWQLSVLLICMIPFLIASAYFNSQTQSRTQKKRMQKLQKASQVTHNALSNIRTVQALGVEQAFSDQYSRLLGSKSALSMSMLHMSGFTFGLSNASTAFYAAAGFGYAGYLITVGAQTPVLALASFLVILMVSKSFGDVSALIPDIFKAQTIADDIFGLIEMPGKIKSFGESKDIVGAISFHRVSFVYPSRPDILVLKQLSFAIEAGQKVAFVGNSGCGKSTILSLLARIYEKQLGTIRIDGHDIESVSEAHLLDQIGLVDQDAPLFEGTISHNISFGLTECSLDEVMQAATDACIHDFILGLPDGYLTNVGERAVQLSGGQKQRLSIARAIVRKPKILLLDEATSALDVHSEQHVYANLLKSDKNRTLLIVAHRLSTIQNVDRIFVLKGGIIAEQGTHRELYNKKGHYYELWKSTESENTDQSLNIL